MDFNFEKYGLPLIYKRCGKDCYLDNVRQKLIYITPEETVRQKMMSYLIEELKVPKEMLAVEEYLSHYGINSKRRADIIIHKYNAEDNALEPLAVIECKANSVGLDEKAGKQMVNYADELLCDFAMVTNGYANYVYKYDEKTEVYQSIESLPTYKDMLAGKYSVVDEGELPERIPFNKLKVRRGAYIGSDIGESTELKKAIPIINLWEGLLDSRVKFPNKQYKLFKVIEDYGVRILSYGNASGGMFSGPYRSFLLDFNGSTEFVSISVSTYVTTAKPDIIRTSLNVAIDNEKETHHSLQMVLDDNMSVVGEQCEFMHHGRIGIGNIGSGKIDELRECVRGRYPEIINGNMFNLGTLKHDRLWRLDDPDVMIFIENLISYALVRDEYRAFVKENKVK